MQSVSSNAVYNYAKQNLYVECTFSGTSITVTNNLHRTDLCIEGICFVSGSTYSYFFRTLLNNTEAEQSITSYGGRQLQDYDMCFINIYEGGVNGLDCIASGFIANISGNNMKLKVLC